LSYRVLRKMRTYKLIVTKATVIPSPRSSDNVPLMQAPARDKPPQTFRCTAQDVQSTRASARCRLVAGVTLRGHSSARGD